MNLLDDLKSVLIHYLFCNVPRKKPDEEIKKFLGKETALDIGCGLSPNNLFKTKAIFGIDIRDVSNNDKIFKSVMGFERFPFSDEYFDVITSFDVLEHIPRVNYSENTLKFPFIFLMNEIYRVLKPNGIFFSSIPSFPFKQCFQDPTHVNLFSEDTIKLYFCEDIWAKMYGFTGKFRILSEGWKGSHYWSLIMKEDI